MNTYFSFASARSTAASDSPRPTSNATVVSGKTTCVRMGMTDKIFTLLESIRYLLPQPVRGKLWRLIIYHTKLSFSIIFAASSPIFYNSAPRGREKIPSERGGKKERPRV